MCKEGSHRHPEVLCLLVLSVAYWNKPEKKCRVSLPNIYILFFSLGCHRPWGNSWLIMTHSALSWSNSPCHRLQRAQLLLRRTPGWQDDQWRGRQKDPSWSGLCPKNRLGGGKSAGTDGWLKKQDFPFFENCNHVRMAVECVYLHKCCIYLYIFIPLISVACLHLLWLSL